MKNTFFSLIFLCSIGYACAQSTDPADENKLDLPGDNFNLAAMLDVFQQSKTLEAFEEKINNDSLKLNNLDLNNDGKTDYVKVIDNTEGTLHTIVLRAILGENDMQDVAVIYVDKKDGKVTVQVVGDETLYGKDYVIEPADKATDTSTKGYGSTPNPAYQGSTTTVNNVTNNYYTTNNTSNYSQPPSYSPPPVNWSIVVFFYCPGYYRWSSPYYWGHYPPYWHPWAPYYYHNYYNHWYCGGAHWNGWWYRPTPHFHYHSHYSNHYYGHRKVSNTVNVNITNNNYRNSYIKQNNYKPGKSNFPSANPRPGQRPGNTLNNNRPGSNNAASDNRPGNNNTTIDKRPGNNTLQPDKKTDIPVTKPNSPSRPETPAQTRPDLPSRNNDIKPNAPKTRPTSPTTKPSAPQSRPSAPAQRPSGSNRHPR
ncbi:MAG: hypothetical protein JNK61_04915 [Bacteroidia bacterium]|nr:hypothetical protein [Bacteroidia bacterium]